MRKTKADLVGKPLVTVPRYRMDASKALAYPLTKYQISKITRQSHATVSERITIGYFKDLAARRLNQATKGLLELEEIE